MGLIVVGLIAGSVWSKSTFITPIRPIWYYSHRGVGALGDWTGVPRLYGCRGLSIIRLGLSVWFLSWEVSRAGVGLGARVGLERGCVVVGG